MLETTQKETYAGQPLVEMPHYHRALPFFKLLTELCGNEKYQELCCYQL